MFALAESGGGSSDADVACSSQIHKEGCVETAHGPRDALIAAAEDGASPEARILADLQLTCGRQLFRLACAKLGSRADAEDTVQAVLCRALGALQAGTTINAGYLFVAIRREISETLARRERVETTDTHTLDAHPAACALSRMFAAATEDDRDLADRLGRLQSALPPRCRAVFELRAAGHTRYETAEQLGISIRTVDAHWRHAKFVASS
jgi:RNA polymerase sigma factor (sigma-70 family)